MRHFLILTNETKDENLYYSRLIETFLKAHAPECSVCLQSENPENFDSDKRQDWIPEDTECILVLGGDGTLLQAARNTISRQIPLLGINLGTLGYLAEVEVQQLETALLRLLSGEFILEERMMLQGEITSALGDPLVKDQALNDVVITRAGALQITSYDIYVNGHFLNNYQADGIILSTPTGSTGYNLSAGGPVAEPKAKVILLTPICPHTTNTRSIILSPDDEITVVIKGKENQKIGAYFDGSSAFLMTNGDRITVKKSDMVTKIVKLNQESFMKVLHKKMRADL